MTTEPEVGTQVGPEVGSEVGTNASPDGASGGLGPAARLAFEDSAYRAAVIDLLGAVAYGEISAFERLAADARMAPGLGDKAVLAKMAAVEYLHFERLRDYLELMGADPLAAILPFQEAFDAFHARTASSDWLEGMVTAYVGDGLAADFYGEISAYLDRDTRQVVTESLHDSGHAEFIVPRVRAAIEEDPRVAGRLALWGRRLMGEALTQAQRVAAERDELTALLAGGVDRPGLDLAAIGRLFARLTDNHTRRMSDLGLDA